MGGGGGGVSFTWEVNPTTVIAFVTCFVSVILWIVSVKNVAEQADKKASSACDHIKSIREKQDADRKVLEARFVERDEATEARTEEIASLILKVKDDLGLSIGAMKETFALYRENVAREYVTVTTLDKLEERVMAGQQSMEARLTEALNTMLTRLENRIDGKPR